MDILANVAAWAGAGSLVALAGWAMGRWHGLAGQGDTAASDHSPQTATASGVDKPRPVVARAVGTAVADQADNAISLCELHEEVTALRHREQILATLAPDALMMDRRGGTVAERTASAIPIASASDNQQDCPRLVSKAPKRPVIAQPQASPQPSPGASPFTRV
ncbi:MAG TPA: hypothetical protein VLA50_06780 [Erythrobacter sp.]|nr:hypothetical protein [Erythrobacter sp.]